MRRRDFAGRAGALGLAAWAAAPGVRPVRAQPAAAAPGAAGARWQNWSGLQSCQPQRVLTPGSEAELAAALRRAPGPIRFVGAGHSFTALVPTDQTLVNTDALAGLVEHDAAARRAVVRTGTRIAALAAELHGRGLALPNQPDISTPSLGGAYATGTHGTGVALPALHAQIRALRLVTVDGQVLTASAARERALFDAARVSLGALGALSQVELELVPRLTLRRRAWTEPTATLLAQADAQAQRHRNFELYLLPHTGWGAGIAHDEVPPDSPAQGDVSDDEQTLADLRRLRDWLQRVPPLRRWVAARFIGGRVEQRTAPGWQLLSTPRATRFHETEFHLPRERALACLADVLATIERRADTWFPIEFRYVAADDAWLSPFHGRASCSIAVHAAADEPHAYLLNDLGPVFRRHGGRPHWGKLHDYTTAELAAAYPQWQAFLALRRELDPQGRLLNPYLRQLFGEAAHA